MRPNKNVSKFPSEYSSWRGMKERCNNPKNKKFKNYGGSGVAVCSEWQRSFNSFLADMGEKPTPKHEIDRIDPEGNYCPENCRWITHLENAQRSRQSKLNMSDAKTIVWLHRSKIFGVKILARLYGVSTGCIEDVTRGKTWKHTPVKPCPTNPCHQYARKRNIHSFLATALEASS